MSKYQWLAFSILPYIQLFSAASIHLSSSLSSTLPSITSTSAKPSTLLLPNGFDSQLPPRQPMLYPFVVPTTSVAPTRKSLGPFVTPLSPFVTPGWIPISSSSKNDNNKEMFTPSSSPTTPMVIAASSQPQAQPYPPAPILEDRVSKYIVANHDNGPVFESIVYGTWKPDPPLQPVEIINATTTKYNIGKRIRSGPSIAIDSDSDFGDSNSNRGSNSADGKVASKTINRQHGGFIDNKLQKAPGIDRQDFQDYREEEALEQKENETTTLDNIVPKLRKSAKKQGRRKIRPNATTKSTYQTPTQTPATMTTIPIESTEQSSSATVSNGFVKFNTNNPVEVVRQINDSIEIKYNHKQTSRHSIEVTAHEHYNNHGLDDYYEDHNENDEQKIVTSATPDEEVDNNVDADDDDDSGGSSVIRMNWPTDFMKTPFISSTSTELPSSVPDASQVTTTLSLESDSAELPSALSSLNIPPSLWPKFPGNITKLGAPYAAESSLEEPAICVPITVREYNMMNSHEIVNIERVFCFPMPSTTMPREVSQTTSTTMRNTVRPVLKANVQNFEDFYELNSRNASHLLRSHFTLMFYVLVIYFKYIY